MNEEINPYAPPKSLEMPVINETDDTVWREKGKRVVSINERVFPPRCVKCNQPAYGLPRKVKLTWHHPGIYALILVSVLIYIIVAIVCRKRATIYIGLCERHKERLKWGRWFAWGGFLLILAGVGLGALLDMTIVVQGSLFAFLPWLIGTLVLNRTVGASRIQDETVFVSGCGKEFLDSLPEYVPFQTYK